MLLKQTILYLPAQLIGPMFLFLSIVVWTHWLSPADLGLYALVIAAQELLHVAIAWFSYYTLRYGPGDGSSGTVDAYLRTEASILALGFAVAAAGAIGLRVGLGADRMTLELTIISTLFMATRSIANHLADRARSTGDILSYSLLNIVTSAVGLLLGLAAVHWIAPTATAALAGTALANVLALALVAPRLRIALRFWDWDRMTARAAIAYGLPFIFGGPLVWTTGNAIRYVIDYWQGAAAVGLMTVGWTLGQRGAAVAAALTTVASFPLAVQRTREDGMAEGVAQLARNGRLLMMALAPAMAGLLAIGPQLTQTLVAADYQTATIAIIPLSVLAGLARNIRIHFTNQIFLLRERPDAALVVDAIDAAVSFILCVAGLLIGGIVGAVAGAALGAILGLVTSAGVGWARFGLVIPFADFARIGVATAVMVLAVRLLPAEAGYARLALTIGVGAGVYAIAITVLFPRVVEELGGLASRLRPPRSGA